MNPDFPVVYLLIYIIILFLYLGNSVIKINEYLKHFLFRAVWIFLAISSGTRVCVGGDWIGYGDLFKSQEDIEFNFISDDPTEVIFRFIAYISSNAGFSFEVFNLIISCLTCYFLYRGIWSLNKNNAFLLTLLYFSVLYFNQQFGIIRTGLAASIFIYSISYLEKAKIRFLGLSLLSYNIHNTSVVPTIIAFAVNRKISKFVIYSLVFFGGLFFFRSDIILSLLMSFLKLFGVSYLNYSSSVVEYFEKGKITNTTFMAVVFFLFYIKSKATLHPFYVNMTAVFILINLVFPYQGILSRFNAFMLIPVWVFIVKSIEQYSRPMQLFSNIILIIYSFTALSLIFSDPDLSLFRPYNTWLFDFNLRFSDCSTEYQY